MLLCFGGSWGSRETFSTFILYTALLCVCTADHCAVLNINAMVLYICATWLIFSEDKRGIFFLLVFFFLINNLQCWYGKSQFTHNNAYVGIVIFVLLRVDFLIGDHVFLFFLFFNACNVLCQTYGIVECVCTNSCGQHPERRWHLALCRHHAESSILLFVMPEIDNKTIIAVFCFQKNWSYDIINHFSMFI